MPTLDFPTTIRPASVRWRQRANTQVHESQLSRVATTYELPGSLWAVTLAFSDWRRSELADLEAFVAMLRGRAGRFRLWNHARETPRGIGTGTPLVAGASQTGTTLNTRGWTPNTAGILLKGDYIGVNGELKMVVADANADASGAAALTFEPPLRASPADLAAITVTRPTAVFRLDTDEVDFDYARSLGSLTLPCMEAIE